MSILIIIFGALTLLAGMVILINPDIIFGFLRKNMDKIGIHILAVVVRLVLGMLLIYYSDISRFPLVIEIIGWISIVAAVTLAVIGRKNFRRLMSWALNIMKPVARFGGILAMAFGGFIIYAFIQ
jgi:hypothetical protein